MSTGKLEFADANTNKADDGVMPSPRPGGQAYQTIENMREMLLKETTARRDGMATLRAIPRQAHQRATTQFNLNVAAGFGTLRRPNLKRGERTRAVSTMLTDAQKKEPGSAPQRPTTASATATPSAPAWRPLKCTGALCVTKRKNGG